MRVETESQISQNARRLLEFKCNSSREHALFYVDKLDVFFRELAEFTSGDNTREAEIRERINILEIDTEESAILNDTLFRLLEKSSWNFQALKEDYIDQYRILVLEQVSDLYFSAFCHIFMDIFAQFGKPVARNMQNKQAYFEDYKITSNAIAYIGARLRTC